SQTYLLGKDLVLKGLEKGIFYKEEDGSVWVDLSEIGLDKKVLLRKDGTSLYLTQDLGTAVSRHKDWPFERLIYVVASEQNYHFKVLFYVLKKLGYEWADNLYHLSYGMVNLPEGKMKSREGTVVDADNLLDQLVEMAKAEIEEKGKLEEGDDADKTAEAIALGALHYFLLQVSPNKDMIFDPRESISLTGNTGPYLQYMGARISSMLRKAPELVVAPEDVDISRLEQDSEWELMSLMGEFPEILSSAARDYNPSLIVSYLYDVGKLFSRYYHDNPIITCEDKETAKARLLLARCVLNVLKAGFKLLNIPFLER
ncbi:arginine--tRNA ligase, partial [Spirochaetia bacterium 38H-sp]